MRPTATERVAALLCFACVAAGIVQGQQLRCPGDIGNPEGCCPCQDTSTGAEWQCERECPAGFFPVIFNDTGTCPPPASSSPSDSTAATASTDGSDSTTADNLQTNSGSPQPSAVPTTTTTTTVSVALVRCRPCHSSCNTCNGSEADDCFTCKDDSSVNRTHTQTKRCDSITEEEKNQTGLIVGVAIGCVAVVAVVVAVVICVCRRRCARENVAEQAAIDNLMDSPVSPVVKLTKETKRSTVKVEMREGKARPGEPIYTNMQMTSPTSDAIQQGFDNVLRYTRDPTLKEKPKLTTTRSEDEELANLPVAPSLPNSSTPHPQSPQDVYEDVENPNPRKTPERPQALYEIEDTPTHTPAKRTAGRQQIPRSKTTGGSTSRPTVPQKRVPKKRVDSTAASTLPYPAASSSCPQLPMFPVEQADKESTKNWKQQRRAPPQVVEEEDSDPAEDYVNVGVEQEEEELVKASGSRPVAATNPAIVVEEPEEIYRNQDAVDEVEGRARYSNTPQVQPGQLPSGSGDGGDDVYGNEVPEDENPYQNVPFGPRQ